MSTSIEARQCRPFTSYSMFADITDAPLVDARADGLLFDGDLTDAEVLDVWWRYTTLNDADETVLRQIDELRTTDTTAGPLLLAVAAFLMGERP